MTIRGARELSVPVLLALLGAAMCAGSLLLRWVDLDLAVIEQWVRTTPMLQEARDESAMSSEQLHVALQAGMNAAMEQYSDRLTGLRALPLTSVIAQVVSAGFVVAAVARFMNRGTSRRQLALELGIAGGFLMFRPIWTRTHLPADDASAFFGGDVFASGLGINVAMAGAALVLVSALMAQMSAASGADEAEDLAQQQAEMEARTGGGGWATPPAGAFVPGMPAAVPAPVMCPVPTAYVPPGPATLPAPTAYVPPGPSTLPASPPVPSAPDRGPHQPATRASVPPPGVAG